MTESISNAMQEPTQINPQDLREMIDYLSSISAQYERLMNVINTYHRYLYWEKRYYAHPANWPYGAPFPVMKGETL